jgi:hypothetical protein
MWGYLYFLVRAYCDGDDGSDLPRLRSVDWIGKSEATISSQLIMPVLHMLGYGEHALHPVPEQQIYKLRDPTVSKGSRRVQFDYEPTIYSEGLWVMEAKGTDAKVDLKTLGPVRDYAVHPRGPAIPKLGGSKVKATREGVLDSVESERSIIGMTG